jgi:hypothetical protein
VSFVEGYDGRDQACGDRVASGRDEGVNRLHLGLFHDATPTQRTVLSRAQRVKNNNASLPSCLGGALVAVCPKGEQAVRCEPSCSVRLPYVTRKSSLLSSKHVAFERCPVLRTALEQLFLLKKRRHVVLASQQSSRQLLAVTRRRAVPGRATRPPGHPSLATMAEQGNRSAPGCRSCAAAMAACSASSSRRGAFNAPHPAAIAACALAPITTDTRFGCTPVR